MVVPDLNGTLFTFLGHGVVDDDLLAVLYLHIISHRLQFRWLRGHEQ